MSSSERSSVRRRAGRRDRPSAVAAGASSSSTGAGTLSDSGPRRNRNSQRQITRPHLTDASSSDDSEFSEPSSPVRIFNRRFDDASAPVSSSATLAASHSSSHLGSASFSAAASSSSALVTGDPASNAPSPSNVHPADSTSDLHSVGSARASKRDDVSRSSMDSGRSLSADGSEEALLKVNTFDVVHPHALYRSTSELNLLFEKLSGTRLFSMRKKKLEKMRERAKEQLSLPTPDESSGIHISRDSILSYEQAANTYRGFINAGILLLVASHIRLIIINFHKYGFLLSFAPIRNFLGDPFRWPGVLTILGLNLFFLIALEIEKWAISHIRNNSDQPIWTAHILNCAASIIVPIAVIEWVHPHPISSLAILMCATCTFMMLFSYASVNAELRSEYREVNGIAPRSSQNSGSSESSVDRRRTGATGSAHHRAARRPPVRTADVHLANTPDSAPVDNPSVMEEREEYPHNLSLRNLYYFVFAPTLCYQLNYPRSQKIRYGWLVRRICEFILLLLLGYTALIQYVLPTVENAKLSFDQTNWLGIIERLLKLSVPNILLWLLMFYTYFHVFLNILAEVLRFGDRLFYRDWWNSTTIPYFWKNWNIPVHNWMLRHVFLPMIRRGQSKFSASLLVFFISALFHELLVSVPFHMIRFWAFSAMIMQLPLSVATTPFKGKQIGNIMFWLSIFIGQPMCILLYTYDNILYQKALNAVQETLSNTVTISTPSQPFTVDTSDIVMI